MQGSVLSKIWNCIYPPILMLALNVLIYLGGTLVYQNFFTQSYETVDDFMADASGIIGIICYVAGVVIFYILFRRDQYESSKTLTKKWYYIPAVCFFGMLMSHGLSILISLVNIDGLLGSYAQTSSSLFGYSVVLVVIRTVILAPVAEELIFRGLVYNRIRCLLGFWPAALISAAIFGVYHLNLAQGIYAFLFGILFCLVYRSFNNPAACVIMHMAANALAVILEFTGADWGSVPVYIIVMAAALAAGTLIYMFVIRKAEEK